MQPLRPADPHTDFEQIAAWFSLIEEEPSTQASLQAYYQANRERITQLVAPNADGSLAGFCWIVRLRGQPEAALLHLYVPPGERGTGCGSRLYSAALQAAQSAPLHKLTACLADDCPQCKAFAEQRGFVERRHQVKMLLDFAGFDDRPYQETLTRLGDAGFRFTSLAKLGDTPEARRRLYLLNTTTDMQTLGSDGKPAWDSFEEFEQRLCAAPWFNPAAQIVAIDTASGIWAAMCALTRFDPRSTHANILFTGVDARYRGRRLALAVKLHALRYARDVLQADRIYTENNAQNFPIISLNRKLGYTLLPGTFTMQKLLE